MAELIVALDFPETNELLSMATELKGIVPWCKVGLEAFTLAGPRLLAQLREMDFQIFLDLKLYDIPNTVSQAIKAAAKNEVGLLSLHCQGGKKMCQAAMEAVDSISYHTGKRPYIFGVTALTSFGPCEMPGVTTTPGDFALQLARQADEWGIDGVICSGQEVATIKKQTSLLALCPGIRPNGIEKHDQARVCTPSMAVRSGADFLVVGRPITRAKDPVAAAQAILEEMSHPE